MRASNAALRRCFYNRLLAHIAITRSLRPLLSSAAAAALGLRRRCFLIAEPLVSIASFLTFSYFAAICCFAPLICSPSDCIFERSAAFCRAFRSPRA